MSYDDAVKKAAFDIYVELYIKECVKAKPKMHTILPDIVEILEIPHETLRRWKSSGDWVSRANSELSEMGKIQLFHILQKLPENVNPDNAAELGRLAIDGMGSVNETATETGSVEQGEEVDDGEIFGDDSAISPIIDTLRERPVDD